MKLLKGIGLGIACFFLFLDIPVIGIVYTLNNTVISPGFVIKEIRKLDTDTLIKEILYDQIPAGYTSYKGAIDVSLNELKPWINEQVSLTVNGVYDYLFKKSDSLNINISLDKPKQVLLNNLTEAYLQSPPPGSPPLTQAQVQKKIESEIAFEPAVKIDSEFLGTGVMKDLAQVRNIISFVKISFYVLIGIAVLLITLIALILREFKNTSLTVGIIFLVTGVLGCASYFIIKTTLPNIVSLNGLPAYVQSWITQAIGDVVSPAGIFNISVLVVGAVLLILTFVFKGTQSETAKVLSSHPGNL